MKKYIWIKVVPDDAKSPKKCDLFKHLGESLINILKKIQEADELGISCKPNIFNGEMHSNVEQQKVRCFI